MLVAGVLPTALRALLRAALGLDEGGEPAAADVEPGDLQPTARVTRQKGRKPSKTNRFGPFWT